jgi:hypothetical protein
LAQPKKTASELADKRNNFRRSKRNCKSAIILKSREFQEETFEKAKETAAPYLEKQKFCRRYFLIK